MNLYLHITTASYVNQMFCDTQDMGVLPSEQSQELQHIATQCLTVAVGASDKYTLVPQLSSSEHETSNMSTGSCFYCSCQCSGNIG